MFSGLDKDYIRANFARNKIGAIRYVRIKTGANFSDARDFVKEVFKNTPFAVGADNNHTNIFAAEFERAFFSDNDDADGANNQSNIANNKTHRFIAKFFEILWRIIKSFFMAVIADLLWAIYLLIQTIGAVLGIECIAFFINLARNAEKENFMDIYMSDYFYNIIAISIIIYIACVGIAFIYSFCLAITNKDPFDGINKRFEKMGDNLDKKNKQMKEQRERDRETRRQARIMQDEWRRRNRWR